jgi:hypothetical protein
MAHRSKATPPHDLLLAFRTITTMLNLLQHAPLTTKDMQNIDSPAQREGQILSALANLLVRQDEVTAVVSQPNQGSDVKIIACTSPDQPDESPDLHHPTKSVLLGEDGEDTALSEPRGVPDPIHGDSDLSPVPSPPLEDFDLCNFVTASNPRRSKKPIVNDAMTFTGPYPMVFESHDALVNLLDPLAYAMGCW